MPENELCAPLYLGSSLILEKAGECRILLNITSLFIALSRSKAEKQSPISYLSFWDISWLIDTEVPKPFFISSFPPENIN